MPQYSRILYSTHVFHHTRVKRTLKARRSIKAVCVCLQYMCVSNIFSLPSLKIQFPGWASLIGRTPVHPNLGVGLMLWYGHCEFLNNFSTVHPEFYFILDTKNQEASLVLGVIIHDAIVWIYLIISFLNVSRESIIQCARRTWNGRIKEAGQGLGI